MTRKMKDSGVEWIGEIPEDWEVVRLKSILRERNEKNDPIKTKNLLSLTAGQGVIPFTEREGGGNKAKGDYSKYKVARPNDLVINSMNIISGSVGLSRYKGCVSPVYYTLTKRNEKDDIRYYSYIFRTKELQNFLLGYGNGIMMKESEKSGKLNTIRLRIPIGNLNMIELPICHQAQQKAIANFLDKKTLEIDNIVSKTKKVIKEYKKYKQSLITETVTKGLDKNVEMKDIGIEWIGEIPGHWSFTKLKYLVNCNEQTLSSNTSDDYKFRYIDIGSVDFHKGITGYENMKYKDSPSRARRIVRKGDLIVSTVRTYLRSIATIEDDEDVIVSTGFAVLTPRNVKKKYLEYMTKTEYFISEVIKNSVGVSYPAINSKELLEINISFPPLKEQKQIASYLHKKTREIDNIIRTKEKLITEMESYKKSLIYETVTGKREVD